MPLWMLSMITSSSLFRQRRKNRRTKNRSSCRLRGKGKVRLTREMAHVLVLSLETTSSCMWCFSMPLSKRCFSKGLMRFLNLTACSNPRSFWTRKKGKQDFRAKKRSQLSTALAVRARSSVSRQKLYRTHEEFVEQTSIVGFLRFCACFVFVVLLLQDKRIHGNLLRWIKIAQWSVSTTCSGIVSVQRNRTLPPHSRIPSKKEGREYEKTRKPYEHPAARGRKFLWSAFRMSSLVLFTYTLLEDVHRIFLAARKRASMVEIQVKASLSLSQATMRTDLSPSRSVYRASTSGWPNCWDPVPTPSLRRRAVGCGWPLLRCFSYAAFFGAFVVCAEETW